MCQDGCQDIKQYGDTFKTNYSRESEYKDIDRAMCYITGHDMNNIVTIYDALINHFHKIGKVKSGNFDNECESKFFHIKFFKKGTAHITFKDERLWEQFNLRACGGKKWLPEAEQKVYEEQKNKDRDRDYEERKRKKMEELLKTQRYLLETVL